MPDAPEERLLPATTGLDGDAPSCSLRLADFGSISIAASPVNVDAVAIIGEGCVREVVEAAPVLCAAHIDNLVRLPMPGGGVSSRELASE